MLVSKHRRKVLTCFAIPRPQKCCGTAFLSTQIGLVLRHRSLDMNAYYVKADVAVLKQVAQPWTEVNA